MERKEIEHLVIPGGGVTGIKALGALQKLEQEGFWHIDNIKSIYATSVGTLLAVLFALKFDWPTINDYIILRPWHEAFPITPAHLLTSFQKKGIFGKEVFELFFKPFFELRDLSLDATMKEFYEKTQIELHFFTVEMNMFKIVDLSYLTHPDLPIIQCVHMSSCIPTLFMPVFIEAGCYVDGGLLDNYPVLHCIERFPDSSDRILGINQIYDNKKVLFEEEDTMLDYLVSFLNKLVQHVDTTQNNTGKIKYEMSYQVDFMSFQQMKDALFSSEIRKQMLEEGIACGQEFMKTHH